MMLQRRRAIIALFMAFFILCFSVQTVLAATGRVSGQVQDSVNNINLMGGTRQCRQRPE